MSREMKDIGDRERLGGVMAVEAKWNSKGSERPLDIARWLLQRRSR